MKKWHKIVFLQFEHFLGLVDTFTPEGFSETGHFMHLSIHVLRSPQFQKYLSQEANFSFENIANLM